MRENAEIRTSLVIPDEARTPPPRKGEPDEERREMHKHLGSLPLAILMDRPVANNKFWNTVIGGNSQ
jgi:hypothetical protein